MPTGTSRRKGQQACGHGQGDSQSSGWVLSIEVVVQALGERRSLRGSRQERNWKEAGCAHGTGKNSQSGEQASSCFRKKGAEWFRPGEQP